MVQCCWVGRNPLRAMTPLGQPRCASKVCRIDGLRATLLPEPDGPVRVSCRTSILCPVACRSRSICSSRRTKTSIPEAVGLNVRELVFAETDRSALVVSTVSCNADLATQDLGSGGLARARDRDMERGPLSRPRLATTAPGRKTSNPPPMPFTTALSSPRCNRHVDKSMSESRAGPWITTSTPLAKASVAWPWVSDSSPLANSAPTV